MIPFITEFSFYLSFTILQSFLVYSEEEDQYVHHDIILPAYPISFEWINYSHNCEEAVNYVVVGDMSKEISIWDIDTVNSLEPVNKLIGHEDAVLDLSWNSILRKMLSSGSADKSCCLWDLEKSSIITRFSDFKDNVQSVKFHPFEAQTLLIGDSNGVVSIVDCQSGAFKKWNAGKCEIEKVIWNHYNPYTFFCSTSDGQVLNFDARNDKKPIYTIRAHSDSVTGLALRYYFLITFKI
jgi:periodic tryptophan protein 1